MATAPTLTYPGVYLVETAPVTHQVTAATTNVTAFIGVFPQGPVNEAYPVTSWAEFEAQFGGFSKDSTLATYAVSQFFLNGGIGAWIVRLTAPATQASAVLGLLTVTAQQPGAAANSWSANLVVGTTEGTLKFTLSDGSTVLETHDDMTASNPGALVEAINADIAKNNDNNVKVSTDSTSTDAVVPVSPVNLSGGNGDVSASAMVGPLKLTAAAPGSWGNNLVASLVPSGGSANPSPNHVDYSLTLSTSQGPQPVEAQTNLDATDLDTLAKTITTNSNFVTAAPLPAPTWTTTAESADLPAGTQTQPASVALGPLTITALQPDTAEMTATVAPAASKKPGLVDFTLAKKANSTPPVENLIDLAGDVVGLSAAITSGSSNVMSTMTAQLGAATSGADAAWNSTLFTSAVLAEVPASPPSGGAPVPRLDRIAPQFFNLMCIPDAAWVTNGMQESIFPSAHSYCLARQAFLLVDPPPPAAAGSIPAVLGGGAPDVTIDDVAQFENLQNLFGKWATKVPVLGPNNIAAATYYPWVQIPDPGNNYLPRFVPPSGTIAGVYATTDETRGVWKAPAGVAASLVGVIGLADTTINDEVNGELNPHGINCLRTFPVYQNVSWGARTLAGDDLIDSPFKYLSVRRLADFIEQSLMQSLKWAVFEPNGPSLWASIVAEVTPFMANLYASGAFSGTTASQAYLVACDATTTTQSDMLAGVVNVQVGFNPVEPAEFVVLNVQVGGLTAPAS